MPQPPYTPMTPSAADRIYAFPEARGLRRQAVGLFAATCTFLLLPFANHFSPERDLGPRGVLVLGILMLVLLLLPFAAFLGLILVTRRAVRLSAIHGSERGRLAVLCLFLGPVGCLLTVYDVTTPRVAG